MIHTSPPLSLIHIFPATSATIDTFCPEKVLINEDFPLLVLPKIPICRRFPEGVSFNVTAILIPSFRCCYWSLKVQRMSESEISLSVYNICKVFLCEFPYLFARDIFQFFLNQLQSDFFRLSACVILEIFHQCHERIGMAARMKSIGYEGVTDRGDYKAWLQFTPE